MGALWGGFVGFLEQGLLWFSILTGSAGFGLVLFTIVARLAILPLTLSSIRSSRKMQQLQPQIKELQRKHGKDQQKLSEETIKLYKENKVNPAASCLPLFLQLPIFFGVYQAVYHLFDPLQHQYLSAAAKTQIAQPEVAAILGRPFLGLIDLGTPSFTPNWEFNGAIYLVLPVLSVVLQLMQQVMAMPRVQDPQQKAMSQAMMFLPLMFAYIAFTFPSGAVFYWVVGSLIGIIQQYFTSGWGSLVNYLPFLPEKERGTAPAPVTDVVSGNEAVAMSGSGGELAATQPRGFWDVLRPLTEQQGAQADEMPDGEDAPTEQAISAARQQGRSSAQRRIRRRR
jgi:YidC/Oxa1 family membrane protein insertase